MQLRLWNWQGPPGAPKPQLEGSPADTAAALERLCEGLGVAFERVADVIREMIPNVELMWQSFPASSMRVPDDAPPPVTAPPTTRRTWTMQVESPHREMLDVLYGGAQWDDRGWGQRFPCQLCWASERWPWEPLRACPVSVSVESTYCAKHRS